MACRRSKPSRDGCSKAWHPVLMTTTFPDRLSVHPDSPHHDAALLERAIGIRLDGVEYTTVEEYCISEGWIRVTIGKAVDRRGRPLTIQRKGTVEPFFKE